MEGHAKVPVLAASLEKAKLPVHPNFIVLSGTTGTPYLA